MIETQPRPTVRTIVASFLFTDLVGFSKGTATDQYAAKANLSAVLRRHLAPLKESDYWIKDTGDGALIAFVSNPEHALYMALALGHDYPGATTADGPSNSLRTGLHLGTVKESIDVEARRNFIGDGINAAKRIMDFAHPGEITASRAFFEAIANLDSAYAELFRHAGASDDKHGRAHELYVLAPSDTVLAKLRADFAPQAGSVTTSAASEAPANAEPPTPIVGARGNRRRLLLAATIVVAVVAIGLTLRLREPAVPAAIAPVVAPPTAGLPAAPPPNLPATTPGKELDAATQSAAIERKGSSPSNATPARPLPPSPPPQHAETVERAPEMARSAASLPAATRAPADAKPRATTPGSDATAAGPSSPRCSRIVEKAALGEPLTQDEKRELATSCR